MTPKQRVRLEEAVTFARLSPLWSQSSDSVFWAIEAALDDLDRLRQWQARAAKVLREVLPGSGLSGCPNYDAVMDERTALLAELPPEGSVT